MSLDNFQLLPFIAQELYKNSLVDLETEQIESKSLKEKTPVSLGNNKQGILIVVNDENADYLQDSHLNFLISILTACNLSMSDVALVNYHNNKHITYNNLVETFSPGVIICLGIGLSTLHFPLEFPHYQVQKYNNQSYLSAPSLQLLAEDKSEKQQLWNCLKKIFFTQT